MEEPLILKMARITPRASIGLSLYPRDGGTPQALLKAADLSKYWISRRGKIAVQPRVKSMLRRFSGR